MAFLDKKTAFSNNNVMTFQITTKDSVEKFSLWDNTAQKFLKENTEVVLEKGPQQVTKYIKLSDIDKKRFTRKIAFNREILFGGEKVYFDFSKTQEDGIKTQLETLTEFGQDFKSVDFIIVRKLGATPLDTEYEVKVKPRGKTSSVPAPEIDFDDIDLGDEKSDLTEAEEAMLESITTKYPDYRKRSPNVWADAVVKRLGISTERAISIVEKHLYA